MQFFLFKDRGSSEIATQSEIHENAQLGWLNEAASRDWDGALIEESGVKTYYTTFDNTPFWRCIDKGNACGMDFQTVK